MEHWFTIHTVSLYTFLILAKSYNFQFSPRHQASILTGWHLKYKISQWIIRLELQCKSMLFNSVKSTFYCSLNFDVEKRSTPFLENYVFEAFGTSNLIELVVRIHMSQISRQEDPCIPFLKPFCILLVFWSQASLLWHLITLPGYDVMPPPVFRNPPSS